MNSLDHQYQTVTLKKTYKSIHGVPEINRFETSIFKIQHYTHCLSCNFCNDSCCSSGVDIDINNVKRILEYTEKIENYIKIPKTKWFYDNYKTDIEFPGGQYTRSKIRNGSCVFINKNGRGCLIHQFCIEIKIDYHTLKPMASSLFPITFDKGLLHPSYEVLDKSLICLKEGPSLYRGVRNEIAYYFGIELVDELDYYDQLFRRSPDSC